MGRLDGRTALVTGASGGIGREIARLLACEGADLILVSRGLDTLEVVASEITMECEHISTLLLSADLALPGAACGLWERVERSGRTVDILVNSAGVGMFGGYADLDGAVEAAMLRLNIVSLTELTRLALPGMLERGFGHILNVASTAAFQAVPYFTAYAATKAYVLSYTEGLWGELTGTGVTATALAPGPTDTGFFDAANMRPSRNAGFLPPDQVGRLAIKAMLKGRPLVVTGILNRLLILAARFAPRELATKISGTIMRSQLRES
jgi:uncharacterized protein